MISNIISQISLLKGFTFTCPGNGKKHSQQFANCQTTQQKRLLFFLFISSAMVIFRPKHLNSKFEPNKEVFSGTETSFYMKKFIEETVHGMVGHMTSENEAQFKKPVCVVYFKVDYKLNPKGENQIFCVNLE